MNQKIYKLHNGCYIDLRELSAMWSEKYADPKLDSECYIARAMFRGNSTILTLGNFTNKEEADSFLQKLESKLQ